MGSTCFWLGLLQVGALVHGSRMGFNGLLQSDGFHDSGATLEVTAADERQQEEVREAKKMHEEAREEPWAAASSLAAESPTGAAMLATGATHDTTATSSSSSSFAVRSLQKLGTSIQARTQRRILMGEVVRTKSLKAMEAGGGWLGILAISTAVSAIGAFVFWFAKPVHTQATGSASQTPRVADWDISPFNRPAGVAFRADLTPSDAANHELARDRFLLGTDTQEKAAAAVIAEDANEG